MTDYQLSIPFHKTSKELYDAITKHIADWWSNDLTGAAEQEGDFFTIAFGRTRKTFHVLEAIPGRKLVWECSQAYIDMDTLKNKAEWEGTRIIWTISDTADGSEVNFLHEGLNQSMECYELCESGWNEFLKSLKSYITAGKGSPFIKRVANAVS